MSGNFNWLTDEETDWTDELAPTGGTAVSLTKRRWFRPLLITASLLLLAGLVVAWQINQRAKAAIQAIEDDIMASYELLLSAADEEDADLFRSLHGTDGRSIGWGRSLDTLMANDRQLLNGRRPGLIPLTTSPQEVDITLAPDLKSAELVTAQTYAVQTAAHVTETITLNQIYNYQLQEDGRWLLAAPDDAFWGEWQTYESRRLRLSYPTRDETISLQIATALDKSLERLCHWSADLPTLPGCPGDMQFQVRWRQEIGSLAALEQNRDDRLLSVNFDNNPIITLPSPTLVGVPTDEAGEQLMLNLFVRQVMAAVIRNVFQGSEEHNWYRFADYNQASLNRLLVTMEVADWPPLNMPVGDSGPPPIPWPEQAIALTCLAETEQHAVMFHLQPENGNWSTELAVEGLVGVQMWPGGRSFAQYLMGMASSWVIIEPDGTEFPVPATEEPVEFMYRDGRFLVAPVPPTEQYVPYSHYYILDWPQCLRGECQWHEVTGRPIWSPDESQLLLQSWPDNTWASQIWVGENLDGPFELIGEGDNPVWLDETTISYRKVDLPDGSKAELVIFPIGGEPETLLTDAVLPRRDEDVSNWFYLADTESDLFLVHITQFQASPSSSGPPSNYHFLLLLDRSSGEMTVVAEGGYLYGSFVSSGRSLIIVRTDVNSGIWSLDRYDIAQKQTETLIRYDIHTAFPSLPRASLDWSEDGRWLLIFQDGFLILLAPDYNYKQVIAPDTPGCFSATWVKP